MAKQRFLIVGAGLAGTCVALQLIRRGAEVTVLDNGENYSSRIAAGMITPLVFRRMNKSWRIDELIPCLLEFYSSVEKESSTRFFRPIPIRRMFSSEQERGYWLKKQEREDYANYMEKVTEEDDNFDAAINNFGSGRVKNAYAVDTSIFLDAMKQLIAEKGTLRQETFVAEELFETTYKGETFDEIVFCKGYLGKDDRWFGYLPLSQTKGETLTIRSKTLPDHHSLNRKCFMLPMGDGVFKIGSTYSWDDATTHITDEGREQILEKLSYLISESVEVLDQQAGIRPTTTDRRALLGTHHEHKHYHIFNGLGTKGYLIAPLLSTEFADYLLSDGKIHPEVCIDRFYPGR